MAPFVCYLFLTFTLDIAVSALKLSITNNGPAVLGSNVTFRAIVSDYNEETLKYSFFDDLRHSESFIEAKNSCTWIVEYPRHLYKAGQYVTKISLEKNFLGIWWPVSTSKTVFQLTDKSPVMTTKCRMGAPLCFNKIENPFAHSTVNSC